jgi:hypothetical protein
MVKKLVDFYNAAAAAMEGECILSVHAYAVPEGEETNIKTELAAYDCFEFEYTPKGEVKGEFKAHYWKMFPILKELLDKGWKW